MLEQPKNQNFQRPRQEEKKKKGENSILSSYRTGKREDHGMESFQFLPILFQVVILKLAALLPLLTTSEVAPERQTLFQPSTLFQGSANKEAEQLLLPTVQE